MTKTPQIARKELHDWLARYEDREDLALLRAAVRKALLEETGRVLRDTRAFRHLKDR